MARRNKPAAVAVSNNKSSVVEKLQMLRSFVGDQHSENDLSSCLSQAGYIVELAAERLMTGQYQQPSKKVKTHNFLAAKAPQTSKPAAASSPPSSLAAPVSKASVLSIAPKTATKAVQKAPSLSTDSAQKSKIRPPVPQVTPKTPKSSSSSSHNHNRNQALEQQQILLPSSWLLCQRWVSNGTCTQRNGSVHHKERLLLEHTETGSPMVRFRGNRIQGQFPKHLSHMLVPLLRQHSTTPMVLLQAEALMEDRNLPVGADVAFSVSIYLSNPAAFFAIFDEVRASSSTAASLFFGKKAAGKRPKLEALPEAAFSLLQWAQQGEMFDFETLKAQDSSNDSEEEMVVQAEEELYATNNDNEDTVPEWAQSITAATENRKSLPEMEGPETVKADLRPYQRQALHWMVQCEKEADTKDLQEQLKLLSELAADQSAFLEVPPDTRIHCECGPVLVSQDEATSCTAVNGDTCTTSHPLWQRRYLASYDRKESKCFYVQPLFGVATAYPPQPPQPCRGGILADSMGLGKTVMLLALICVSKEQEEKGKHGTTLVVAPLSLLAQWEEELETKTSLSYRVHYADKKLDDYNGVDVVVTTYGSLQGELQVHMKKRQADADLEFSGLLGFGWKRVILDEAHCIKNAATGASKACCMLQAERRWCVSGTIIQNSLDDAYALLKFLRHEPWCEHGFWKAAIGKVEDREVALDRVKRVLQPIMLRRTKETLDKDGKPILTLPPVETKTIMVEFTPAERQFYDALHEKSLNLFEGFIQAGTENKSWLAIFSLLNRLRQTCDHVALTVRAHLDEEDWTTNIVQAGGEENAEASTAKKGNVKAVIDQKFLENLMGKFRNMQAKSKTKKSVGNDYASQVANMLNEAVRAKASHLEQECAICLDPINIHDALVTPCIHIFCKGCLIGVLQGSANSQVVDDDEEQPKLTSLISAVPHGECPYCKEDVDSSKILRLSQVDGEITTSFLADSQIPKSKAIQNTNEAEARQVLENAIQGSSSSKLTAIIQELDKVWEEDAGSKVLIFSQYLGFLDLIEKSLQSSGIPYSRLDGKLSLKQRVAVLDEFGKAQPEDANSQAEKKIGSVLLVSMKAGGVGLNLVAARSVFIADPWWNAAVEDQCVSRIHRIGQTASKVRVRKFYVANSVEQRIVELQNRKKSMASEVLCDEGKGAEPRTAGSNKPSMDDFKILFRDGR